MISILLIPSADRKPPGVGGRGRGRGGRDEGAAGRQAKGIGRGMEDAGAKGRGKGGPGAKSGGKGMKCSMQVICNFVLILLKVYVIHKSQSEALHFHVRYLSHAYFYLAIHSK